MPEPSPAEERREQMAGELAEWLHAAAREAQRRLMEAESTEEFAQLGATLAKLARGVRQSMLVQRRFETDRLAGGEKVAAAKAEARALNVDGRKARLKQAVARRLHDSCPEGDGKDNEAFNERLERLDARVDDIADEADFLDLDPDLLIARLSREFGLPEPAPRAAASVGPARPAGPQVASAREPPPPPSAEPPRANGHAPDSS